MSDKGSSAPEQPEWWYQALHRDLTELASETEQRRLWLSDGRAGKDASSFIEISCRIFDDLGLSIELEEGTLANITSKEFAASISHLNTILETVNDDQTAEELIASLAMEHIREIAKDALSKLEACHK